MFCRTVGHARRQTAPEIGPSTIDRSKVEVGGAASGVASGLAEASDPTGSAVEGGFDAMRRLYQSGMRDPGRGIRDSGCGIWNA
ncbi:MAG TPA: hypothetical protein VH458_23635 [Vicinamibacterales bacterium]|jgi:hypothetical protein